MQYVLTGFTQDSGFRVFAFQGVRADQTRVVFTVRTDLALIRTYGILVQELPLLCRALLELREAGSEAASNAGSNAGNNAGNNAESHARALTYTEDEMRLHANHRTADRDAAQRKKSLRRIPPRVRPAGNIVMGMARDPAAPTLVAGA